MHVYIGKSLDYVCVHIYVYTKFKETVVNLGQKCLKSHIFGSKMNYVYTNKPFSM